MKRFHTKCSELAYTRWKQGGVIGVSNGIAISDPAHLAGFRCTIISAVESAYNDGSHDCIVEVADEHEAKLLAAGLKPVEAAKPQIVRMPVWEEFKTSRGYNALPTPAFLEDGVVKPNKHCCVGGSKCIGKVVAVHGDIYEGKDTTGHTFTLLHGDVEVMPEHLELARKYEVKPVAEVPESDEAFVKRHYPMARLTNSPHDVKYYPERFGGYPGIGPGGRASCDGMYDTPELAWAQAAKEVRTHLALHPQQSAPRTRLFYNVRNGYAVADHPRHSLDRSGVAWSHHNPHYIPIKIVSVNGKPDDGTCTIEVSEPHIETAEKWLAAAPIIATISSVAIGSQSTATSDVVHITPQATIATIPDPTPTTAKPMIPDQTPTTAKPMTQQPTQRSWMQRCRDAAKQLSREAEAANQVAAFLFTLFIACDAGGITLAVQKNDVPWLVALGIITPMVATIAGFMWFNVYVIATRDYVPPTPAPKVKPATLEPRPASRRTVGRFIWWAMSSAAKVAFGYGVYWLQSNWSAVCFDLGVFLQRISGGV